MQESTPCPPSVVFDICLVAGANHRIRGTMTEGGDIVIATTEPDSMAAQARDVRLAEGRGDDYDSK
jgi:hypothetical protein